MKKRSRVHRQRRRSPHQKALEFFAGRGERKRRTWTFERLEDRNFFSATPLNLQTQSISSATPEGAAEIMLREMLWQAAAAASTSGNAAPATTFAIPGGPLLANQWHLRNIGQEVGNPDYQHIFGKPGEDLNMLPVWLGQGMERSYTGAGVIVAVLDSGVQMNHPDLAANISNIFRFDAITGDNDPSPRVSDPTTAHGTAVAGIIAAVGSNNIGGSGIAPGATIAPIRLIDFGQSEQSFIDAFRFGVDLNNNGIDEGIDITNNSWGPGQSRTALGPSEDELLALRDSIIFGRDGKGVIHVFASGNSAGPFFVEGFPDIGNYSSSTYDGWVNSRYTIGVTGVDHDGLYANVDGTFTSYPEVSAAVLVAAPTGSNAGLDVGQDTGTGSGIFTTDLVGDDGYNESPLPNGQELDRDFLDDVDYTSRFNGTSAAAPMVSGVIALMLEANPDLTWRDVQEILVRSARQNAQFEFPSSGALTTRLNTWQTNQTEIFQNPDRWLPSENPDPFTPVTAVFFPKAIPTAFGHFEPQPQLYTNGAGYTVSQGYGVFDEMIGYGHGTVDAALAVRMAEKWDDYGQTLKPELTFTSFVLTPGFNLPAAERGDEDSGFILVPGAIGGESGFIEYWNQYFIEDDPEDPEDGPFSDYDGMTDFDRGLPYLEFDVPDDNAMSVESVEVKVSISGPPEDLDFLRIMLMSPEGTVSELNHFYTDPEFDLHSVQSLGPTSSGIDPAGDIDIDGGNFVWTFTTKRSWGERSGDALITNATTGDPYVGVSPRGWRLFIENWSNSAFDLSGLELTWHGQSIQPNTQRVQGFVGIDENDDKQFNYSRSRYADEKTNPAVASADGDSTVVRRTEVQNFLDLNQEKFAENILVEAYRVVGGVEEIDPVARFLTGADGNYYFDLVPGNYNIKVVDPMDRVAINDATTPSTFLRHYKAEWNITEAWFKAADHDDATRETKVDATGVPVPFMFGTATRTAGVKNVNFLLDPGDVPVQQIVVNGTVYADFNGNGNLNGNDTAAGEVVVYVDVNKNGAKDAGEPFTFTLNGDATRGKYTLVIPTSEIIAFQIGVERPSSDWAFADPSDGTLNDSGGPGSVFNGRNFFIQPPSNTPPGGGSVPGSILGAVFNDHDGDRVRDSGDEGLADRRVFVDVPQGGVFNGVFDAGELSAVTDSRGAYMISNVPAGPVRLEIEPGSDWALTTPTGGYHQLQLGSDGTLSNNLFGLKFLATRDFGDLPDSYSTLEASGGPWHTVVPGFQMGTQIDGEVVAQASSSGLGDDLFGVDDDDGIVLTTNSGRLEFGANTLQVTLQGIGGLLNAWMDFNHDGDFNDAGERIFTNLDRNPGTYSLNVNIQPGADLTHRVATRFRWGAPNLGVGGGTFIGEVEDYLFSTFHLTGDYNSDFEVDNLDRAIYWATFGSTTDLRADGNHNGVVDSADFAIWRDNSLNAPGGSAAAGAGGGASVFNAFSAAPRPSVLGSGNFGGFIGNVPASVGSAVSVTADPSIDVKTNVGGPSKSASVPSTLRFAYSNFHFGQALETHVSTLASEQAASNADADQDLLLLDQAWAALAPADKLDRAFQRTADDAEDESMCASDLALAALFGDELDWRPSM